MVQQPQLHLRTTLTWHEQTGVAPLSWTVRPTEERLGRPRAEMLRYALGELKRIPVYSQPDKKFCVMPSDWSPCALVALEEMERRGMLRS